MLAPSHAVVCSQDQHDELMRHVRLGRLFELMEWVEAGQPTLCPDFEKPKSKQSTIREAIDTGNHSMVRFLWEQCWQRPWEIDGIVARAIYDGSAPACEIAKYLMRQGLTADDVCASAVFETHDDELILMALENGLCVRAPDGFASALSGTGHSKHLIRLYRELRDRYPDLVTEGLLALREAVEKEKVRAIALLTWAGVDPLQKIPYDPYEETEPSDDPDDDPCLSSALDEVRIGEKARDILKALKVEMTEDLWFQFIEQAGWLEIERFPEVYHWIRNPDDVIAANPQRAAKVTTAILKHLEGWGASWKEEPRQRKKLEVCEYLAWLGVPMLVTGSDYDVRQIRKGFSKAGDTRLAVRLLWLIHEKGDEAQKARLKEIVRTPKLQSLVRQHDRYLLRDLGLGPKRETNFKVSKKDRAWQMDTYKPPTVCEKPAKERSAKKPKEPELPPPVYYPPPASPPPVRRGYWNRYSHFHR
jgi:hypothetical protein